MEKEKLLLSRLPPPQLSQPHLNSLGSSPTNSTSNSMEFHPHHHQQHQHQHQHQHQQQQQQHNHHNNKHVGVGVGLGDLNCFRNLNWENSMMGGGMDNSALSSMVSSPLAPPQLPNSTTTNSLVIRELIGRLGSICNSGDPQFNNSHSTMLELDHQNHQQQPHNPSPSLDPGFCERAAKYSCFNSSSIPRVVDNGNGSGKLSRVSSTQSLLKAITTTTTSDGGKLLSRSCSPDNNAAEFEESSASDPNLKDHVNNNSSRKRKAAPKPKSKDLPSSTKDSKITAKDEDKSNAKRSKPSETTEKEKVVVESPKDYIHVRARRGQATDSHSLAERVRREKISERMKFLQDLVPGCNKVTGKAVMLDEIINYVQSLQRQVEMLQSHGSSALTVHPTDALASTFPYGQPPHQGPSLQNGISNGMENHCSMPLDTAQRLSLSMQLSALDGFGDGDSQLAAFWEDDLQSIVQMGFGQNQGKEVAFQTQNFHGSLPTSHMKVEL